MGIRGLTTFINNRSHLYLKDHELHDCNVVLDGNSIASNLYKWHCKSNDCFGGDYDKYAHVIRQFFDVLSQCNVTPYVIFDGGYERRKLNTVRDRMRNKIQAAQALNAITDSSDSVFPLFLREVFMDIVLDLGIKVARCAYEADMEIAGIARALDCPVMSYDSDFLVFGCLYIPFSTVELVVRKGKGYKFIPSKIYRIENFLETFGGLDRNNLPLLAVLLGNDYIKGSLFKPFFRNLKIQKCSGHQNDQQKRIKSIIVWLQNEDVESGIKTVLSRFKGPKRKVVLRRIKQAMKAYFEVNSELLHYLQIEPVDQKADLKLDFVKLDEDATYVDDQNNNENSDEEEMSEEEDIDSEGIEQGDVPSRLFRQKYRDGKYGACFMDMITLNRYYCVPQVEEGTLPHSHTVSLDIISIIHKIITPYVEDDLKIVCRNGKWRIKCETLPRASINVPTLEEIVDLSLEEKRNLLFNFLSIDNKLTEVLNLFPLDWQLMLISLSYAVKKKVIDKALIYSCLICFLILNYIDPKVGFCRVSKTFSKKYASTISKLKDKSTRQQQMKIDDFRDIPYEDCLIFMDKMIPFFQMDSKLKVNHRLYDKILVHSLAELQSVYLHIKYLNALLSDPYPMLEIHKLFDGTFIYNMTVNLRRRTDIGAYLSVFLNECPSVLDCVKLVGSRLEEGQFFEEAKVVPGRKVRRKKHKKTTDSEQCTEVIGEDAEECSVFDPNNPYSILSII